MCPKNPYHFIDEDNKKAAFQRVGGLSSLALKFGTPIPISAAFALTREEYSIWRRVSKSKAPKVFTNGAINAGIDTCHAGLASLMKNFTMLPSLSNWLLAVNEIGESAENAAI